LALNVMRARPSFCFGNINWDVLR